MNNQPPDPHPHTPNAPPAPRRRNFFSVAADLGLLEEPLAKKLNAEAAAQGIAPAELVRGKGLLSPTQLEIVDSLCRPYEIVPGYKLQSLIGHGGMGVVYRAQQLSLKRDVALKTVLVHKLAEVGGEGLARFEREAQLVARLAHPHIVTAHDFGRSEGRLFLAMEFVAGEDLEQMCQRAGPLAEAIAWQIIRQTAAGLAHACQQEIVHRDIKPSNLLITTPPAGFPLPVGAPFIKIADFGLAWLAASSEAARLTSGRLVVGTPQFMAPEQLQGDRITHQADIYALGATAWRLLAGQQPLQGLPVSQIVACKLSGQFPPLATVRTGLAPETLALVGEMTERDPKQRPRTYAELLARIDQLLSELSPEPTTAHPWPSTAGDSFRGSSFAGGNLAATLQIHQAPTQVSQPTPTRLPAISWLTRGLFAAALILSAVALGLWVSRAPNLGAPDLRPTGQVREDLFNGRDTDRWATASGQWSDARNESAGAVLQGLDGIVARSLHSEATSSDAWLHYQLNLVVEVRDAKRAEIWFDLSPPGETGEDAFLVLLIDPQAVQVVQRWKSRPHTERVVAQRKFSGQNPRKQIELAGHTLGWFIQADEQRLEPVRRLHTKPAAEFRLAAVGGAAWFSDFVLTELGPGNPQP